MPAFMERRAAGWPAPERAAAARVLRCHDVAAWHWPGLWAPGAEDSLPLDLDGWTGSGVLRLDDRAALVARLLHAGCPGPDDDATLAWRSFRAWGDEAARHWIGDYAVAAVSPERDRLVVSRGVTGVRSCFHVSIDGTECVSDDLALLAALAGTSGHPAEQAVVEFLRFGYLATPTLTFHAGITRIPAAHTLVVRRDGARRIERHWHLPEPGTRHDISEADVVEGFREVLGAAIADRLRGPRATVLLSGGLDSPTLAVVARDACPQVAIEGITVSWARLFEDGEAGFARMAAVATGIDHEVWEHAPDDSLFDETPFCSPEPLSDPEPRLVRARAARLATHAPVALLGEDVDALLTPLPLAAQLRLDGVARTIRAWRDFHRLTGARPWIGARRSIPWLERWRDRRTMRPPRWLRPDVAGSHPVPDVPPGTPHPSHALAARSFLQPIWDATCWLDDPRMSGADVVVLLPFMDPRVIRFCLSLPSVPWLQRKHLLRRAMRGHLPTALLERAKSPLGEYASARVRVWREGGGVSRLPKAVDGSVASWVDVALWRRTLDSVVAEDVMSAWRVLELSRWLQQPTSGTK